MTNIVERVLEIALKLDPTSPLLRMLGGLVSTVEHPTELNIVGDIQTAYIIIMSLKERLEKHHQSLWIALKEML